VPRWSADRSGHDANSHGALVLQASGAFTYTPTPEFGGNDSFTYVAVAGALSSAPAVVSLTVDPVNDPPTASADAYAMDEDATLTSPPPAAC